MTDTVPIATTQELRGLGLTATAFNAVAMRDGLVHVHRASFDAADLTLAQLSAFGAIELAEQLPHGASVLLRPEPSMVIYLHASRGHGEIPVAAVERDAVDRVAADIVATLRDPEDGDEQVAMTFWAQTAGPPMNPRRRIVAPRWPQIAAN